MCCQIPLLPAQPLLSPPASDPLLKDDKHNETGSTENPPGRSTTCKRAAHSLTETGVPLLVTELSHSACLLFWVEIAIYFLDPKPWPGFSIWPQRLMSEPFECHAPWAVYKRALSFHPLIPKASLQMFLPGLERPPDSQAHVCAPTRCYSAVSGSMLRLLNPHGNAFCALPQ